MKAIKQDSAWPIAKGYENYSPKHLEKSRLPILVEKS